MISNSTCFSYSISLGVSCISRTSYKAMENSWYADKLCRQRKSYNVGGHGMFKEIPILKQQMDIYLFLDESSEGL